MQCNRLLKILSAAFTDAACVAGLLSSTVGLLFSAVGLTSVSGFSKALCSHRHGVMLVSVCVLFVPMQVTGPHPLDSSSVPSPYPTCMDSITPEYAK